MQDDQSKDAGALEGVEDDEQVEVIDDSSDETVPYRYQITSYGVDYPVDTLIKRLKDQVVFVPQFQRGFVWPITRASRFVESLILGLPVPGIFLSKEPNSERLLVIDGQQRLRTLQFFYDGLFKGREFRLQGVEERLEGKTYRTLDQDDRLRLDDSVIHATIVKQEEPTEDQSSIFHIFERLNTGGLQLQAQEIRVCIFHGPFIELLRDMNANSDWRSVYGKQSPRLKDQELILRFFSFLFDQENYAPPLKEFLNKYLASNRKLQRQNASLLTARFSAPIGLIARAFGNQAFRPERALNAAVFDSVMVGLALRLDRGGKIDSEEFKYSYDALLMDDEYLDACGSRTANETNVRKRLELATEAFKDL